MPTVIEQINQYWYPTGHLNVDERDFLIRLLQKLRPRHCLETGFASGRSTITTLVAAQPEKLISVDLSLDYLAGAREHADRLQRDFPNLKVIEGNSQSVLTPAFFAEHFPQSVDFAFIDGDHTYRGCRADLEAAITHLAPGGVIAVDDYRSGPPNGARCPEVDAAVDDVAFHHRLRLKIWSRGGKGVATLTRGPMRINDFLTATLRVTERRIKEVTGVLLRPLRLRLAPYRLDTASKKFSQHIRRVWLAPAEVRTDKIILLDLYTLPQTHISRIYFANVLAQKHSARIHLHAPPQSPLFKLTAFWRLLRAGNVAQYIPTRVTAAQKQRAHTIFQSLRPSLRTKQDLYEARLLGIWFGIDVYESYLKRGHPTVDLHDHELDQLMRRGIELVIFWQDFFSGHDVAAVVASHDAYLDYNIVNKVAFSQKIPVYMPSSRALALVDQPFRLWAILRHFHAIFQALPVPEQVAAKAWAKQQLTRRLSGEVGVDMPYTKKTAFTTPRGESRVLRPSPNTKVLICSHCFFDNPHGLGGLLFTDFYEWLQFLAGIARQTPYDWYLKVHPDPLPGTLPTIQEIIGTHTPITVIPPETSHRQLAQEGLDVVLTAFGTVGLEYPALGIQVINAGYNPRAAYNFNWHPSSVAEYRDLLLRLPALPPLNIKLDDVYECYFMHYRYVVADSLIMNSYEKFTETVPPPEQISSAAYEYFLQQLTPRKHDQIIQRMQEFIASGKHYDFRYGPVP